MPKEKKKLTIKELKEISPLIEVVELSQFRKYLIMLRKPSIVGIDQFQSMATAREIARICQAHKIPVQILVNVDFNDIKFYEVG